MCPTVEAGWLCGTISATTSFMQPDLFVALHILLNAKLSPTFHHERVDLRRLAAFRFEAPRLTTAAGTAAGSCEG